MSRPSRRGSRHGCVASCPAPINAVDEPAAAVDHHAQDEGTGIAWYRNVHIGRFLVVDRCGAGHLLGRYRPWVHSVEPVRQIGARMHLDGHSSCIGWCMAFELDIGFTSLAASFVIYIIVNHGVRESYAMVYRASVRERRGA